MTSAARRYSSASQSAPRCRYSWVDAIERCPAWACRASIDMPASRSRVRHVWRSSWQVPMRQAGPSPGAGDDLVQPLDRQRLAPAGTLQHHEQPIRRRASRPLVVHVGGHGGEEAGRHRHQPLMAALALGNEHPPLTQAQILKSQAEHLAPAQPAQRHRLHHGPVPIRAQRPHQRGHLLGIQNARQPAHRAQQRLAPQLPPRTPGRQTPRDRVRLHPHITADDQIPIQRRDRRQTPADRRRRQPEPPSEIRTTFSAPGRGRRCAVMNAITSAGRTSNGSLPTTVKNVFRSCAYARTVFGRARLAANSKNSSTSR